MGIPLLSLIRTIRGHKAGGPASDGASSGFRNAFPARRITFEGWRNAPGNRSCSWTDPDALRERLSSVPRAREYPMESKILRAMRFAFPKPGC